MRLLSGLAALGSAVAALCISGVAFAQGFPSKPIRLIVPYGAGTSTDILARQLSEKASTRLGQAIVVTNRPGGSAVIGTMEAVRAPADGYTLEFGTILTHATAVSLNPKLPYDPIRDFTPIVRVAAQPQVLVVTKGLKVNSVSELVSRAKAAPRTLNFGSTGNGTGAHLLGELFKMTTGIDVVHVPYNGPQVFVDLIAGTTSMMFYPYAPIKTYVESGQITPLAMTGAKRVSWLPQTPTFVELGYPDVVFSSWYAIYGPAGVPREIAERVAEAYRYALEEPGMRETLAASGTEAFYGGPAELAAFTASEIERLRKIVVTAKITAD